MSVPKALEQAAKEAEELHKKMYPEQYGDTPDQVTPEGNTGQGEQKTPEPEKGTGEAQPQPTEPTPEVKAPEEEAKPVEVAQPEISELLAQVEGLKADLGKLQHSHEVLKGKYNAEVKVDVSALQSIIDAQNAEIETLKAQLSETPPEPKKEPTEAITRLAQEYGEDFVNDMRDVFRQEMEAGLKPFKKEVEGIRTTTAETAYGKYLEKVTEKVPNWRTIKNDPKFAEFLAEVDPGSGISRYDLAKNAMDMMDAERTIYWYNTFLKAQPEVKEPKPKKDKERLIAPASQPKGQPPSPEKPFYTASQLRQFADDVTRGAYKNKPEEAKKIQADFDKAIAERRIIAD